MNKENGLWGCCGNGATSGTDARRETTDCGDEVALAEDNLKEFVRERYGYAAESKNVCGCGSTSDDPAFSFVGEAYEGHDGYRPEADLGLGCGVPTDVAVIKAGDSVLDLGSGAGIDAFIARELTGPSGKVTGVDFTPKMIQRATKNAQDLGYENVHFVLGDIEELPIEASSIDVILSNCVLNLVPRKRQAFSEMFRVLKPGGRFAVSDVVIQGTLPERLRESARLYAECVSGAIALEDYLVLLADAGFADVRVVREHTIHLGAEFLDALATPEEIEAFTQTGGIRSVTISGSRPVAQ